MPHMPDSHHDTHDLELVAAFAAGDATGAGLETATALVATCADCAALHDDLRAIAVALPALPAPVRTRDFRLTPAQAASLRPTGIRALLAAFASPRLSFATPLGTGLAAIGLVGVLVASGGLPVGGGATSGAAPQAPDVSRNAAGGLESVLVSPEAGVAQAPEAPVDGTEGGGVNADPVASAPAAEGDLYGALASAQPALEDQAAGDPAADARRPPDQTLLILTGGLLLTGLALVALRWASRRLA